MQFVPRLQGLKQQLRALEWLMERHFPALAAHLQVVMVICLINLGHIELFCRGSELRRAPESHPVA